MIKFLYVACFCACAAVIGAVVGAVAGVGIAGMVLEPEEAVVLVDGVTFGAPIGALAGVALAAASMVIGYGTKRRKG